MAGSNKKDDSYQPKTVIWREKDYEVHLGQVLGVLDFDTNFDDTFQRWKLMMQFIIDVGEAIKQNIIPLKENNMLELTPNQVAIDKMTSIWYGQTYLRVIKNHEESKILGKEFFYEEPSKEFQLKDESEKIIDVYPCEIIPMPCLKNMIPIGQIDSEYWGVQIRETICLKIAWQGANYATVINDGKFVHNLADGLLPKITQQDMNSTTKRTYILHRPVYNAIMDILPRFMNENYFVFAGNVQRIMKWMKEKNRKRRFNQQPAEIVTDEVSVKTTF